MDYKKARDIIDQKIEQLIREIIMSPHYAVGHSESIMSLLKTKAYIEDILSPADKAKKKAAKPKEDAA